MLLHLLLHFLFLLPSLASPTPVQLGAHFGVSLGGDFDDDSSDDELTSPFALLGISSPGEGNAQEDVGICSDYGSCSVKGLELWGTLHATLNDPNAKDKDLTAVFEKNYEVMYHERYQPQRALLTTLIDHNLDITHLDVVLSVSVDPVTGSPRMKTYWPYENAFDTKAGVLIAISNFREHDHADEPLPWSEIMYQTWQSAYQLAEDDKVDDPDAKGGGPISDLKHVIQHIVVNAQTQKVVQTAYQALKYTTRKIDPDPWKKFTENSTPLWFCALLATDNVKGTVFLLNDHSVEMGRKTISEIWTRWDEQNADIWYVICTSTKYIGLDQ
ncbi:MAG: hypothetical protein Q9226_007058 [Calogaya cf. arnoldii]